MQRDGKSLEALDLFGFGKIAGHTKELLLALIKLWETRHIRRADAIKCFDLIEQSRELHTLAVQGLTIDNERKQLENECKRIENDARMMESQHKDQRHQLEIRSLTVDVERKERENPKLSVIDIVVDMGPATIENVENGGAGHRTSKQVGTTKPTRPRKISAGNAVNLDSSKRGRK